MQIISLFLGVILIFSAKTERVTEEDLRKVEEKIKLSEEQLYKSPETAVHYANQAVLQAGVVRNDSLLAVALYTLSAAYTKQGVFDLALDACFQAYEIYPKKEDAFMVTLCTTIGDSYRLLRDYNKAMEFLDKSYRICVEKNYLRELGYTYNVRGLVYVSLKNYKEAESDFLQALKINRRLRQEKKIAANLNNLATFPGGGSNFKEKIKILEEALEINTRLNATWSIAENYNNFGLQYYYAGNYRQALEYLDKSLATSEKIDAKELILDNYKYRSRVYKAMGNIEKAYQYLQMEREMEGRILSAEKLSSVETRITERKLKEHENRLLFQEKEFRIRTLNRNLVLIIVLALLVSSLLLIYSLKLRSKKNLLKLNLERQLEHQKNELMSCELRQLEIEKKNALLELSFSRNEQINLACYIKSRNDLLEKISTMIREAYSLDGSDLKTHLKKLNSFITQYTRRNSDIKEIINRIEALNADFINRLTALHPDLTKGEIKLASYLRIGLSNKDISLLTEVSPTSLNVSRYRLRKRLQLSNDESLIDFMRKI